MNKLLYKIKNWLFYKTTTRRCGDFTVTDVGPRFKFLHRKRKYKTNWSVENVEAPIFYNE